jgi:hypothetical protein
MQTCVAHTGSDPLANQFSLEFGHHAHHSEDGFAQRHRGVERLAKANQVDADMVRIFSCSAGVCEATGRVDPRKLVQTPDSVHLRIRYSSAAD